MLVGWLTVAGVIASANLTSEGSAHVEGGCASNRTPRIEKHTSITPPHAVTACLLLLFTDGTRLAQYCGGLVTPPWSLVMKRLFRNLPVRVNSILVTKLRKWRVALRDKPLLRHLSVVLLLKIALLWLLWAAFISDQRVEVDPARMGNRLSLSPSFSNSIVVGGNNDRSIRC